MDIRFVHASIEDITGDALLVGTAYRNTPAKEKQLIMSPAAREVDSALDGLLQTMFNEGEFKAEVGELATIHTLHKLAARRVIVAGLGALDRLHTQQMQRAFASAARSAQATGAHSISLAFDIEGADLDEESQAQAAAEGALLGIYTFKKYQHANG